jgi:hypothetical protein
MTTSADCRDIRHALGVYVLGAIDPAERAVVDSHLSSCPECREELAGLAAAAAVVLVAGAAGAATWSALNPAAAPAAHWDTSAAANAATHVSATVRYTAESWGTAVDTQVHGLPDNVRCSLVVTDTAGQKVVAGSWKTSYDEGKTWYTGGSSVMLDALRSFSIVSGGRVLVTIPAH